MTGADYDQLMYRYIGEAVKTLSQLEMPHHLMFCIAGAPGFSKLAQATSHGSSIAILPLRKARFSGAGNHTIGEDDPIRPTWTACAGYSSRTSSNRHERGRPGQNRVQSERDSAAQADVSR